MMQNGNVFVGVVLMLGALNHSNGFELKWNRTGGDFVSINYLFVVFVETMISCYEYRVP